MKYNSIRVVTQEIPNELSLVFYITGCPNNCIGCHSPHLNNPDLGLELSNEEYLSIINTKGIYVSNILFMGGDWEETRLLELLKLSKSHFPNKKLSLYSGSETVSEELINNLNYLKLGPYIESLGGLDNPCTNQTLVNLDTGEDMRRYFIKTINGEHNV